MPSLIACEAVSSLRVTTLSRDGGLAWTHAPVPGICTVQAASAPAGPWTLGQNAFEGGPATAAALSRPHIAMIDRTSDVYIAGKNSHSVLKVTPDGTIRAYAGTHTGGFNGEGPAAATTLQLNSLNGLWVRPEGTAN
jgi:hypothetical protein